MLRRRDRGEVTSFTRVVIETSGLADPAPILHTLMTDAAIAGRLTLSAVVTTVDAVTGASTLAREQVSVKQVALADHLIVTKSDLAPAVQAARSPCRAQFQRTGCPGATRQDRFPPVRSRG